LIPIIDDIQFLRVLEKGGRTKPWLVRAYNNGVYENYVIKVFDQEDDQIHFRTASEFYGVILAEQFDLLVPEYALFDLSEISYSLPEPQRIELEEKGFGLRFGSKFINDSYEYVPSLHKYFITKRLEVDSLFAFDLLINNADRTNRKPNILFRDEEVMLIDHELAFKGIDTEFLLNVDKGQIPNSTYHHHICFSVLKNAHSKTKVDYFNTFEELLRVLSLLPLQRIYDQLDKEGIPTGNFGDIKSFLDFAKANHPDFVNIIRGMIV